VRRTVLTYSFSYRLVIMTLVGALAAILAVLAFAPTTAVATHNYTHMRTPFDVGETWIVTNGYGEGKCHKEKSPCGGDEFYALDLVPVSGKAGGRDIYSPVRGTVVAKFPIEAGNAGQGIKIKTQDGRHLVHLYHLMDLKVSPKDEVTAETLVGQTYNQYGGPEGPNNHLHIQLSNLQGVSQPITLAGKLYSSGQTWDGQEIRENVVFANPNYGNPHWWFVEDVSDMRKTSLGNDVVSSLRVNPGCEVTLYEHNDFTGQSKSFSDNVPDLAKSGFNNKTSSVRLLCRTAGVG
jgi:Peptidase family M23/Beta/Gamma crystallin